MPKEKKLNVAVLFGGKSAEHEVSVLSARSIVKVLDRDKYNIQLIGINKKGQWLALPMQKPFSAGTLMAKDCDKKSQKDRVVPYSSSGKFLVKSNKLLPQKIDVVIPILHGPMGEDGTMQGLLKLANIPFVGADVLGSAIGMDKDVSKRLLRDAGIPIAKFLAYRSHEKKKIDYSYALKELGRPFFVKPANLGSSVGIAKVSNEKEFSRAVEDAFSYDTKILLEKYIAGREIECSVLGNEKPRASVCGDIIPKHAFYSYEAKYLDKDGASLRIPARINKALEVKMQRLALKTFETLCCEGMARVDFFLTENDEIFVNEINTIPGFTSISMYPKLWEASGVPYSKLLDTLIDLAIQRFNKTRRLQVSFCPKLKEGSK